MQHNHASDATVAQLWDLLVTGGWTPPRIPSSVLTDIVAAQERVLVDTRPTYWKHKRRHGHHCAARQLHFPTKEVGLDWVATYHPHELAEAKAAWADDAPLYGSNIWANGLEAPDAQGAAETVQGWQPMTHKAGMMTCAMPAEASVVEVLLRDGSVSPSWFSYSHTDTGFMTDVGLCDFMRATGDQSDMVGESIGAEVVAWRPVRAARRQ